MNNTTPAIEAPAAEAAEAPAVEKAKPKKRKLRKRHKQAARPLNPFLGGLITRAELGVALRKNPRTITEWTRAKKIPYIKVGSSGQADMLFDLNEVIAALKKRYGCSKAA
jgi:hypothetical protein